MSTEDVVSRIRNPLAMVAIFAAISEVAMAIVIKDLPATLQGVFIWFVMGFPLFLVSLFFFVLYRKPAVFFAPSDYKKEELYVASIGQNTPDTATDQRIRAIEDQLSAVQDFLSNAKPGSTEQAEYAKLRSAIALRQELEVNPLYAFVVGELRINHEVAQRLIVTATDALHLSRLIETEFQDKRMASRLTGLVSSFPSAATDFQNLKLAISTHQGHA